MMEAARTSETSIILHGITSQNGSKGVREVYVRLSGCKARKKETTWKTKAYVGRWDQNGSYGDDVRTDTHRPMNVKINKCQLKGNTD
jgi:hypothetical protein